MTTKNFLVFRALTSFIFIYAGTNHLLQHEKIINKAAKSSMIENMANPLVFSTLIQLSGIMMIIAGLLLLIGYRQKLAAWTLLLILIPITLTVQLENMADLGPFFKNVAIAGSLLFIINHQSNEIEKPVVSAGLPGH